eukprot:TRINITY_DN2740_c0_g1_i1.p1 TRINITY_DN2740_c0_g1~~TRINITY_DN2740_c0_g1_i1.p1  ORF type:complete len:405 (-),score=133.75 TRINITY_DN2740_c0_g1_i1:52-1266(-)
MRLMRERHLVLVKEMDAHYKAIEAETQEHFAEFLEKWKRLAKNKIEQYRIAFILLKQEKEERESEQRHIIGEFTEKTKRLKDEYDYLLVRYNNVLELGRVEGRDKEELLHTQYDGELSRLRQEKIELEGLLEGMKTQNVALMSKMNELRKRVKVNAVVGIEEVKAVTDNYISDCVQLVVAGIVNAVEVKDNQEQLAAMSKIPIAERQYAYRQPIYNPAIKESSSNPNTTSNKAGTSSAVVNIASTNEALNKEGNNEMKIVPVVMRENNAGNSADLSQYDGLLAAKARIIREIQIWRLEFEEREGRKCEKADCEPIRHLYHELRNIRNQISLLKGENMEGLDDSIISLEGEFIVASKSNAAPAELETLRKENENLKEELHNLRISITKSMPELSLIHICRCRRAI